MDLEGIKLSQLRILIAVAEYGNFSEAALQLGISQSAVSHAIANLEAELGVMLLSRGRHGATLTPVGQRILPHAQEMVQVLERIGREANLAKGLQGGQVRIASFRSVATHILAGVLAGFHQRYPGIAVTITEYRNDHEVEQSLREGRIDIGFNCTPTGPDFDSWELLRDEYLALFPPRASVPPSITWADIAQYPLILPPTTDYCSARIRDHLTHLDQRLQPTYEIMEDSTIVSMVSQGVGATIMARLAAKPLPPEIQVRTLPVPLERIIRVTTLGSALHPPAVYAFLELLHDSIQSAVPPWSTPLAATSFTAGRV
jgi:DNA-binding transcriptional LysR family regulator